MNDQTDQTDQIDLAVRQLGECRVDSPLLPLLDSRQASVNYVDEADRVLLDDTLSTMAARGLDGGPPPGFEPGGPRRKIYFDPAKTRVGIVTCGGLCPGLNNVIRALVMELTLHYKVSRIFGFRNGYQGFIARYGYPTVDLTPDVVRGIHEDGGTMLGASRGSQDPEEIVDCLERMNINVLFVIGGDGTMRGALRIAEVAAARGERIAVVGIPKTIDNDIPYIDHSYAIRSVPANPYDSVYCLRLAHAAVHAAMAGRTAMVIGRWHGRFVHVPIALAVSGRNQVDPHGDLWMSVLEATGQPVSLTA